MNALESKWFEAVRAEDIPTMEYCLRHGVTVDILNNSSITALGDASGRGLIKSVKFLIEHKANVNHICKLDGYSPLLWAALNNHLEIVKLLIEAGADINHSSGLEGNTALHLACGNHDNNEMLKYLVSKGANISVLNNVGDNAILRAVDSDNLDAVKYTISLKLDINHQNNKGYSPLLLAARYDHYEIALFLLMCGADITLKNKQGNDAYSESSGRLRKELPYWMNKDREEEF